MLDIANPNVARRRRDAARDYCGLKDYDLRRLLRRRLKKANGDGVAIVEELNLPGDVRADVARAGSLLHGYELKSGLDTMKRLPRQADAYATVFDRCTVVTVDWHLDVVEEMLPDFWGLIVMRPGRYDDVLVEVRRARAHDRQCAAALLQLLTYEELLTALRHRSLSPADLRGTKARLATVLDRLASKDELRDLVRGSLVARAQAQVATAERRREADFELLLQQRRNAVARGVNRPGSAC